METTDGLEVPNELCSYI